MERVLRKLSRQNKMKRAINKLKFITFHSFNKALTYFILTLTLFGIGHKASASEFIETSFNKLFISSLKQNLLTTCLRVNFVNGQSFEYDHCLSRIEDLLRILNFKTNPSMGSIGGVAFYDTLIKLIKDHRTWDYLSQLTKKLQKVVDEGDEVNLYDFTLRYFKDKNKSIEVIAVLFQDNSSNMHLDMIWDKLRPHQQNILENISQKILVANSKLEFRKRIHFYPKIIAQEKKFLPNLYHFYVPLYLSLKLHEEAEDLFAFSLPVLLTINYKYLDDVGIYESLRNDRQIGPDKIHLVNAIFMSLKGAIHGSELIDKTLNNTYPRSYFSTIPLNSLQFNFMTDPWEKVLNPLLSI